MAAERNGADPRGPIIGGAGAPLTHESADLHVSGSAPYTDDIPEPRNLLHAALGLSSSPHARITRLNLDPVRTAAGVVDVITADDIPGANNYGPVLEDDPILAPGLVQYAGQPIFAVVANNVDDARRAALLAEIDYQELDAILEIEQALASKSFVLPSETLTTGDSAAALAKSRNQLSGKLYLGGQDHFYLEGQIAMALPKEGGDVLVYSSTQHPVKYNMPSPKP